MALMASLMAKLWTWPVTEPFRLSTPLLLVLSWIIRMRFSRWKMTSSWSIRQLWFYRRSSEWMIIRDRVMIHLRSTLFLEGIILTKLRWFQREIKTLPKWSDFKPRTKKSTKSQFRTSWERSKKNIKSKRRTVMRTKSLRTRAWGKDPLIRMPRF